MNQNNEVPQGTDNKYENDGREQGGSAVERPQDSGSMLAWELRELFRSTEGK